LRAFAFAFALALLLGQGWERIFVPTNSREQLEQK